MLRALLAAVLLPAALDAQQIDLAAVADTVFGQWNSTHTPGCAVGVARDGKVLLTKGYGMADLESATPITPATIFESGSVAKQFTATAVVLLARDGKLDLEDPVRKYIPELPDYGRPITIRHLLTHTSGLREWSSLVAYQGWPRGRRAHEQSDLLDVVFKQTAINYPVGEYYSYTNSGYALAMTLVERVSGMTFQQFSQERIFRPLGMTSTQWRDDFTRLVPGRAQAYERELDGWHLNMPFESVVGPGGLLTTAGDWLTWNEALAHDKLAPGLADSLTRRMRLNNGREIEYALGLSVGDYRGVPEISHGGATAGYRTFLARYPEHGNLSVAVLCNAANANASWHVHQLVDRLVTNFPAPATLDTTPVDPAMLARYAGVYRSTRNHQPLRVTAEGAQWLRALPDGSLHLPNGARWRFTTGSGNTPTALDVIQPDGDTVRYTFAGKDPWSPTARDLQAFVGSYRSDELGVTYQAKLVGDTLKIATRPGLERALRPTYRDGFQTAGTAVWFSRDGRGRVTAMHFSEPRVWDLVLPRVEQR